MSMFDYLKEHLAEYQPIGFIQKRAIEIQLEAGFAYDIICLGGIGKIKNIDDLTSDEAIKIILYVNELMRED